MSTQLAELRQWRDQAYERHLYATAQLIGSQVLALSSDADDAYWLAQTHYATGDYLRAAHVLKSFHWRARCRYLASLSLIAAHKLDEARELLEENVLEPDDSLDEPSGEGPIGIRISSLLSYLLGQVYTLQNQPSKAKDAYCASLRADPRCFDALDQLTRHALLNPKEEWRLLKSLDLRPLGPNADLARALYGVRLTALADQETQASAVDVLSSRYGLDIESNQECLITRANALFNRQLRFSECREVCERAVELDPYNLRTYVYYVGSLAELQDKPQLYRIAHELAARSPDEPVSWYAVGVYYRAAGQLSNARRHFSKASIMDPSFLEAWLGFAHTFADEGEHEQAITAYTTAARLFQGSHVPYLSLGIQHARLGNWGLAEECLLTAQSVFDDDPLVLNERGVVSYHRGDYTQAVTILNQALELCDRLGCAQRVELTIKTNLAFVHRRLDNFTESLEFFYEVALHSPLDANILAAMGLVHLQTGDTSQAFTRLNQALALSRDDPLASDLLTRAVDAATSRPDTLIEIDVDQL